MEGSLLEKVSFKSVLTALTEAVEKGVRMFGKGIRIENMLVDVVKGKLRFGYTSLSEEQLIKASGRIALKKTPPFIGDDDTWEILNGNSLVVTVKLENDMKVSFECVKKAFDKMVT